MSGVDLHSKIADSNSGVFVSTKKDDVKLPRGYGIALAIAPRTGDRAEWEWLEWRRLISRLDSGAGSSVRARPGIGEPNLLSHSAGSVRAFLAESVEEFVSDMLFPRLWMRSGALSRTRPGLERISTCLRLSTQR